MISMKRLAFAGVAMLAAGCNGILGNDPHGLAATPDPDGGAPDAPVAVGDDAGIDAAEQPDVAADASTGCAPACSGATPICLAGACVVCAPGSKQCDAQTPQTCDATGQWQSGTACGGQTPICAAGACGSTVLRGTLGTLGPHPASAASVRLRDDGLERGPRLCTTTICVTGGITP